MPNQMFPHLSRPAIEVAVIAIYYNFGDSIFPPADRVEFEKFVTGIFPVKDHNTNTNVNFIKNVKGETEVRLDPPAIDELRYKSADSSRTLAVSKDVFAININSSYTNWEEWIDVLKNTWNAYLQMVLKRDPKINRASTRFINKIQLKDFVSPSDYFRTTLYAEEGVIPGTIGNFTIQYSSFVSEEKIEIKVTQGTEAIINNIMSYLLDIDVICLKNMESDELWPVFDRLRELKNVTFFNNLTDKTIEALS